MFWIAVSLISSKMSELTAYSPAVRMTSLAIVPLHGDDGRFRQAGPHPGQCQLFKEGLIGAIFRVMERQKINIQGAEQLLYGVAEDDFLVRLEYEVNLEGKTPSNGRREDPAALPPLLGRDLTRPATKGATPPWIPLERFKSTARHLFFMSLPT